MNDDADGARPLPPARTDIAARRLLQQRLAGHRLAGPADVVSWLCAVQAQDYPGAKWAIGLRMRDASDVAVERAFADGTILRTHVMRPTWHFVSPKDLRWMLELTAPRIKGFNAHMHRELRLDEELFSRSNSVIARALEGRRYLTREELGVALADAGIVAKGPRLAYLIMRAELDAVVSSGPRRGRQSTYALLDERVPQTAGLGRDEALGELALRYFKGHGPATLRDLSWWSGLTATEAKAGLRMASHHLESETMAGGVYWFPRPAKAAAGESELALLLPAFDEFFIGYSGFGRSRSGGSRGESDPVYNSPVLLGGLVIGSWRRAFKGEAVIVDAAPFANLGDAESELVSSAAERYGRFVGMPVEITITKPSHPG